FHQIYKCARAQIECDENHGCYYNFERDAQLHGIFGDLWSSTSEFRFNLDTHSTANWTAIPEQPGH
ncbi:hypothetical protein, partial [Nitrosomonas mobilis]|uniref:hypothetical protein n=1 Tax=Nitrosomonas mobilis TaxID=51642 RepID=UPI001C40AB58